MSLLGIDLHSNRIIVARLAVKSETVETVMSTYTFERDSFQRFLDSLRQTDYVLVENTFNAFWFHDQIAGRVKECLVFNTNEARNEGNKSDKIDARKLAKKLGYYLMMGERREDLPTVYVVGAQIRELRGLFTTYQLYKKAKVQLKNRIHSILKQNGICIERGKIDGKDFDARIDGLKISGQWKFQIRSTLKTLRSVHEEQGEIKDQIYFLGYKLFKKEIELLMSIRGFSAFTAIALMSDVVDVNRFCSARKFCSYLRATPKVKSSNRSIQIGHVNRQSRPLTCSLLTQSILQLSQAGEHMSQFYGRVRIGKSAGKSRIALIRKILVSAYHMLNNRQIYHWVEEELYSKKLEDLQKRIRKLDLLSAEEKKPA